MLQQPPIQMELDIENLPSNFSVRFVKQDSSSKFKSMAVVRGDIVDQDIPIFLKFTDMDVTFGYKAYQFDEKSRVTYSLSVALKDDRPKMKQGLERLNALIMKEALRNKEIIFEKDYAKTKKISDDVFFSRIVPFVSYDKVEGKNGKIYDASLKLRVPMKTVGETKEGEEPEQVPDITVVDVNLEEKDPNLLEYGSKIDGVCEVSPFWYTSKAAGCNPRARTIGAKRFGRKPSYKPSLGWSKPEPAQETVVEAPMEFGNIVGGNFSGNVSGNVAMLSGANDGAEPMVQSASASSPKRKQRDDDGPPRKRARNS